MPSHKQSKGPFTNGIIYTCFLINVVLISCDHPSNGDINGETGKHLISEINAKEIPLTKRTIAITGAMIVDGNGGEPVPNGCVVIKEGKITEVGINGEIKIPAEAEIMDAKGMTLLPGFIDAHFHLDEVKGLPAMFLRNGVTSIRDPGAWIEAYDEERKSGKAIPWLFLSGPHLDMFPPAYPDDAYIVRDALEAVNQVNKMCDAGSTVIKVYFRLPPGIIREICKTAHGRGIPVTAHLETTEAIEAIEEGLDGIEHITSFGLSLQTKREGEKYRQLVFADNNARKQGRYDVWKNLDINGPMADSLTRFLVRKGTFITPTLGAFEYQMPHGGKDSNQSINLSGPQKPGFSIEHDGDTSKLIAFNNMKALTAKLKRGGARIVVGSHSVIPYADLGWAFQREMELLVESGISNSEVIVAATMENARFFRIDDRLGSIEKGKIADMVLVKGNPLKNIKDARNIVKVMLNGNWIN